MFLLLTLIIAECGPDGAPDPGEQLPAVRASQRGPVVPAAVRHVPPARRGAAAAARAGPRVTSAADRSVSAAATKIMLVLGFY